MSGQDQDGWGDALSSSRYNRARDEQSMARFEQSESVEEETSEEEQPPIAQIRVATELSDEEMHALQAALERHFHCALHLEVKLDPTVLGGVWVRVEDTLIDGTIRGRLTALRHHLHTQSRIMISTRPPLVKTESDAE